MDNPTPAAPDNDPATHSAPKSATPDWNNPYTNPNNIVPTSREALPSNPYANPAYNPPVQTLHLYGNQPYQGQTPTMAQPPKNTKALISLIVSLATFFVFLVIPVIGTVAAIVSVVFGHKALAETKESYGNGRGMALTGLWCGYSSLVLSILWTGFWVLWLLLMFGTSSL